MCVEVDVRERFVKTSRPTCQSGGGGRDTDGGGGGSGGGGGGNTCGELLTGQISWLQLSRGLRVLCVLAVSSSIFDALSLGACVVRDSNSGHQLLLPPANWCPMFASRTTHRTRTLPRR